MSFFSCFGKKEKKEDIGSWLEEKFPGEFEVVRNIRDLQPRHYIEKKITSVVAAKDDPEVQFSVIWYKDQPGLGITVEEIETSLSNSRIDVQQARIFAGKLKENQIQKTSVGVMGEAVYILPFTDPTPEAREKLATQILQLLEKDGDPKQSKIWIEWMEDSIYGKEFTDIIPDGYWRRGDSWHDQHKILSLNFDWSPGIKYDSLRTSWIFNTTSNKSMELIKDAYQQALRWAEQNLLKPFYLESEQYVQFELDTNDLMMVHYSFPYFTEKINPEATDFESKIEGYVTGAYHVDERKFSDIKKAKEL